MGSVAFGLDKTLHYWTIKLGIGASSKFSKTNQIRRKKMQSLGFKKKTKSAACFVFATTTWFWSREVGVAYLPGSRAHVPAPALKSHHCCACQWAQELQNIEIDDQKKNLNEKKKSFVWMFRVDLKKQNKLLRQKTKNSLLIRAIQKVIAVF